MGKYVDLSDMKDTLTAQAINAGQSFLAGKATSTFSKVMESEDMRALTNAATAGMGLYSMSVDLAKNFEAVGTTLVSTLINHGTEAIMHNVTDIAVDFVEKHVSAVTAIPGDIAKNSLAYFNSYKLSLGDLLKEFIVPIEIAIEEQSVKSEESKQLKFINDIKDKYMKNRTAILNAAETGVSYMNMITSYVEQGPEWVENKIDECIGACVEGVQKVADEQWDIDKKKIDAFVQHTSEEVGSKLVEKYNNILRTQAKKLTDKKQKEIQKLVTDAHTKLQKVKLKIMAKTGINLPI